MIFLNRRHFEAQNEQSSNRSRQQQPQHARNNTHQKQIQTHHGPRQSNPNQQMQRPPNSNLQTQRHPNPNQQMQRQLNRQTQAVANRNATVFAAHSHESASAFDAAHISSLYGETTPFAGSAATNGGSSNGIRVNTGNQQSSQKQQTNQSQKLPPVNVTNAQQRPAQGGAKQTQAPAPIKRKTSKPRTRT